MSYLCEQSEYLAAVDGWGTVRSPMRRGVREEAKRLVREIFDGVFPPRARNEQVEGIEVLRLWLSRLLWCAVPCIPRNPDWTP